MEVSIMPVEGELDNAKYRMREKLGDGEINGQNFEIALNIDGGCMLILFEDGPTVKYNTVDMVRDAYKTFVEEDQE
jgi:hypothetical protein